MKLPVTILRSLIDDAVEIKMSRRPDFIIANPEGPYLRRWFVTEHSRYARGSKPQNRAEAFKRKLPNIYVHEFLGDDEDSAHHDHPWWNLSLLLLGSYDEHTIAAGGVHQVTRRTAGDFKLRAPRHAHRISMLRDMAGRPLPCTTLFITGPTVREWGFHCPMGWKPWKEFVDARDHGKIGRGCA